MRNLTEQGKYDAHLLADYSREEFDELNGYINHWRDMNFAYAAVKQMEGKYLIQNRVTKRIYESPQFLYLLVAMCLFAKYPAQTRLATSSASTTRCRASRSRCPRPSWRACARRCASSAPAC